MGGMFSRQQGATQGASQNASQYAAQGLSPRSGKPIQVYRYNNQVEFKSMTPEEILAIDINTLIGIIDSRLLCRFNRRKLFLSWQHICLHFKCGFAPSGELDLLCILANDFSFGGGEWIPRKNIYAIEPHLQVYCAQISGIQKSLVNSSKMISKAVTDFSQQFLCSSTTTLVA